MYVHVRTGSLAQGYYMCMYVALALTTHLQLHPQVFYSLPDF